MSPRAMASPGPLLLTALPLLWVVASAVSKRHGLVWFLAGLAVLRLAPGVLGGVVANDVYSGYHVFAGGIYRRDRHMGYTMRPGLRQRIYWNGHWWWHEANADGYRGPALARAEAVFLGDSMVYGHGLETGETVPARFASRTGLTASNLGQQGTCLLQALMILRDKGLPLRPRLVFVCSHPRPLRRGARREAGRPRAARERGATAGLAGPPPGGREDQASLRRHGRRPGPVRSRVSEGLLGGRRGPGARVRGALQPGGARSPGEGAFRRGPLPGPGRPLERGGRGDRGAGAGGVARGGEGHARREARPSSAGGRRPQASGSSPTARQAWSMAASVYA